MRLYDLLHELVIKFAPMDEIQALQMKQDATSYYGSIKAELQEVKESNKFAAEFNETEKSKEGFKPIPFKPVTLKLKAIEVLEHVFSRYAIAILFMVLVPVIQRAMNGSDDEEVDPDEARRNALLDELSRIPKR